MTFRTSALHFRRWLLVSLFNDILNLVNYFMLKSSFEKTDSLEIKKIVPGAAGSKE